MIEIRDVRECGRVNEPTDPESLRRIAAALELPATANDVDILRAIGALKAKRLN